MAKRSTSPRVLPDTQRAELFQGLARTLDAGLDAVQALNALRGIADGTLDDPLTRAAQSVGNGTALLRSLTLQGLISPHDQPLLAIAESNGAIARACEQLATRYQRAAARWRQMKGKLLMPAAVLVIAIVVLPLPALVAGRLGISDYVRQVGAMLVLLAMLVKLLAMFIAHWRAHGTPAWLTRLARVLPVCGPMSHLHQRAAANERLALALRCGSPADAALQMLARAEGNAVRKKALAGARRDLASGVSLSAALHKNALLDAQEFAIVSTGEAAGRLDDSIDRVATACHDTLDGRYGVIAQWLPVCVYLCVAAVVSVGLLG